MYHTTDTSSGTYLLVQQILGITVKLLINIEQYTSLNITLLATLDYSPGAQPSLVTVVSPLLLLLLLLLALLLSPLQPPPPSSVSAAATSSCNITRSV